MTWLYLGNRFGPEKYQSTWDGGPEFGKWEFQAPTTDQVKKKCVGYWKRVKGLGTRFAAGARERNLEFLEKHDSMKWFNECQRQIFIQDPCVTANADYMILHSQEEANPENIYYARQSIEETSATRVMSR